MSAATLIFTLHKTNFTFLPFSPQWTLSKSSLLVIKCLTCHRLVAKFSIKGCKKTTCQQQRGLCQPFFAFLPQCYLKKTNKSVSLQPSHICCRWSWNLSLFVWQTFTSAQPKPDSLKNQYCLSKRDAEDTFILYFHQV